MLQIPNPDRLPAVLGVAREVSWAKVVMSTEGEAGMCWLAIKQRGM